MSKRPAFPILLKIFGAQPVAVDLRATEWDVACSLRFKARRKRLPSLANVPAKLRRPEADGYRLRDGDLWDVEKSGDWAGR